MLWVFDRNERLQAILDNANKQSCPYYDASETEVLNGEHTFQFKIPLEHEDAEFIKEKNFIAVKDDEDKFILFVIQEVEEIDGLTREKNVFCESARLELLDEIIESVFIDRKTPADALTTILTGTRWTVGTVEGTEQHTLSADYKTVLETLEEFGGRWGGELQYRVNIVGNAISNRYVDYLARRGADTFERLEYERDTELIRRTIDARNVKTALFALGAEIQGEPNPDGTEPEPTRVTLETLTYSNDAESIYKDAGRTFIYSTKARDQYGLQNPDGSKRHLYGVIETNAPDATTLLEDALTALRSYTEPIINYEVRANEFGLMRKRLGDNVYIINRDSGLELTARIIERRRNPLEPDKNELVLGNFLPLFTDEITEAERRMEERIRDSLENNNYLERGETIYTHWLEREINLANQEIIAGGGTVHISDNDGVLITDKPTIAESTKAIKLNAGALALANEKNADGSFNYRTFGTGEGFLADLVNTGFIRFDRARGGTLQLGGELVGTEANGDPIFQNGVLKVYNREGVDIATLDGDTGGFEELFIGEIRGRNVVTRTMSDYVYYVHPLDGNDENDGLTTTKPLKTIREALKRVPKLVQHEIKIFVLTHTWTNLLPASVSSWEVPDNAPYVYGDQNPPNTNRTTSRGGAHGNYARWIQWRQTYTGSHMSVNTSLNRVPCTAGKTYTFSSSVYANVFKDIAIRPIFWDASGVATFYSGKTFKVNALNTWERYSFTMVAPAGAVEMGFELRMFNVVDFDFLYFDGLMIHEGDTIRPFLLGGETQQGFRYSEPDLTFNGFVGSGVIRVFFGEFNLMEGEITVNGCNAEIYLATKEGGNTTGYPNRAIIYNQNAEGYRGVIHTYRSAYVYANDLIVIGNKDKCSYNFMGYASYLRLNNVECYEAFHSCITGAYGSRVEVNWSKGTSVRGLYAHGSSVFGGSGTAPAGTSVNTFKAEGGSFLYTNTHDAGSNPLSTYSPLTTTTWKANDSWSYNSNTGWTKGYVYQGKRPNDPPIWYGVIYFNLRDFSALKNADGTLRPIHKVRLQMRRTSNTGENTARKPRTYYSSKADATGGAPVLVGGGTKNSAGYLWGEQKFIELTKAYGEAFRDGTAKSIVLYDSNTESDYMRFESLEFTLEITHG